MNDKRKRGAGQPWKNDNLLYYLFSVKLHHKSFQRGLDPTPSAFLENNNNEGIETIQMLRVV